MAGPGARVVLIIGASSGIGRAAAAEHAARGDHVVLASRSAEALDAAERWTETESTGRVRLLFVRKPG